MYYRDAHAGNTHSVNIFQHYKHVSQIYFILFDSIAYCTFTCVKCFIKMGDRKENLFCV